MLQIVMGLEERITREEFDKYAPDAPYITRIAPAQIEDDFGRTVVARGDDAGVILIIKSGGAEIDEPDFRVEEDFALIGAAGCGVGGGRDPAGIGEGLVIVVDEEDIFRFEIGVNEVEVMEDCKMSAVDLYARDGVYSQATLVNSCFAKCWI